MRGTLQYIKNILLSTYTGKGKSGAKDICWVPGCWHWRHPNNLWPTQKLAAFSVLVEHAEIPLELKPLKATNHSLWYHFLLLLLPHLMLINPTFHIYPKHKKTSVQKEVVVDCKVSRGEFCFSVQSTFSWLFELLFQSRSWVCPT